MNNLGTVYSETKDYENAVLNVEEAIRIFENDKKLDPVPIEKSKKNLEAIKKKMVKR